jgi:hypothetical protein
MTQIHTKHHVEAHEHLNLPTFDLLLEPLVCVTSEGRQLTPGLEVICSTMHLLNPHYPSRRLMPSPQGFTAPETVVRHFCFAPGSQSYMFLPIPTRPSGVNAPPTVERWPSLLQPLLQLGPVYTCITTAAAACLSHRRAGFIPRQLTCSPVLQHTLVPTSLIHDPSWHPPLLPLATLSGVSAPPTVEWWPPLLQPLLWLGPGRRRPHPTNSLTGLLPW